MSKTKSKKDPNAPKGVITSYLFFCRKYRPIVKLEHPDYSFTEIGRALGARWRQLSPEEKAPFTELSKKDKVRYEKEMRNYKEFLRMTDRTNERSESE